MPAVRYTVVEFLNNIGTYQSGTYHTTTKFSTAGIVANVPQAVYPIYSSIFETPKLGWDHELYLAKIDWIVYVTLYMTADC